MLVDDIYITKIFFVPTIIQVLEVVKSYKFKNIFKK